MNAQVNRRHRCVTCGHVWESQEDQTAKAIIKAAEVNKTGPYCGLCHHLEMAARYAAERGFRDLRVVLENWPHSPKEAKP